MEVPPTGRSVTGQAGIGTDRIRPKRHNRATVARGGRRHRRVIDIQDLARVRQRALGHMNLVRVPRASRLQDEQVRPTVTEAISAATDTIETCHHNDRFVMRYEQIALLS